MEVVETTMCNGVVVGIEGYTDRRPAMSLGKGYSSVWMIDGPSAITFPQNWENMSLRLPLPIMTVQQNASCDSSEPELELYITGKPRLLHSVNLLIYV
jgi:hypothetical protein